MGTTMPSDGEVATVADDEVVDLAARAAVERGCGRALDAVHRAGGALADSSSTSPSSTRRTRSAGSPPAAASRACCVSMRYSPWTGTK